MKQPHTEQSIEHTEGQQNTGNHSAEPKTSGGTRAAAKNVEPPHPDEANKPKAV